jgi:hypothetical protein
MIHFVLAAAISTAQSQARYYGPADLSLTAAVVQAGGGPASFSSRKLFFHLAGSHGVSEALHLTEKFGVHNMAQFFATFNTFVDGAIQRDRSLGISLPAVHTPPGDVLSRQLYQAGVTPDGRYDVGYMIEHLFSRPGHVALMREVNASPSYGPAENAEFHVILTTAIQDLHSFYAP